jgi:ferredoxin
MTRQFMAALHEAGIDEQRIRVELFSQDPASTASEGLKPRLVTFQRLRVWLPPRKVRQRRVETLLDTAQAARIRVPCKCTVGSCGTCKVKVLRGRVIMDEPNSLTAEEVKEGYVLACVAYPCESVVVQLPTWRR